MSNNIKPNNILFRDGTGQQDRYSDALNPANIRVEDRSLETLITEAQRLAKEIRFFNEQNEAAGSWESFLVGDVQKYQDESPTGQEIIKQQWAQQLAAYVEAPERFQNDAVKLAQLSRPHVVLFVTFLQLLNYIKSQINGLTKKHLDFYFLERLQLTPKKAVPDVVNVLVHLADNIDQLEITAGTTLLAGKDNEGNELHYKTDKDTVISQAGIAQLKTVFVEKATLTIKDAHLEHLSNPDKGFNSMMEMALGDPHPGNPLPPLPDGINNLVELSEGLESDAQKQQYVKTFLFLTIEDFKYIIRLHLNDLDTAAFVSAAEWQEVYSLLDKAYKTKVSKQRQQVLKTTREQNAPNGFDVLMRQVYGSPAAGDRLPLYQGAEASLTIVYNNLLSNSAPLHQEAAGYITNELFLTEKNFVRLIQVSENPAAPAGDWEAVYEMLELAERKVRSRPLPSPFREELINVYAAPEAAATAFSLSGEKEESLRFKTFGGHPPGTGKPLVPATLGLAISSPLLLLQEGKRQITCYIGLDAQSGDMEAVKALFTPPAPDDFPPLQVALSTGKEWILPAGTSITFGDYVVAKPESIYKATLSKQTVTISSGGNFTEEDIGKYLVWTDGNIFIITGITASTKATVKLAGTTDNRPVQVQKYSADGIYLHTLRVMVQLSESQQPVLPVSAPADALISVAYPVMKLVLNHVQNGQQYRSRYQQLIHLKMEKLYLEVAVQGLRNLTLQNDFSTIDARKPFEPFGYEPQTGNSIYLANKELAQKRLDSLQLDFQWMNAPDSFSDYYKNYWLVQSGDPALPASAYTIKNNDDFTAQVSLIDKGAALALSGISLFSAAATVNDIPGLIQQRYNSYQYQSSTDTATAEEDVLDWNRYFRLELSGPDFQHSLYNTLPGRQAVSGNEQIKALYLNPPYTPRLKQLSVGYSAHAALYPGAVNSTGAEQLYHLHPFGIAALKEDVNLLPSYNEEGALYLGINRIIAPQTLSILFQMAEGSANPDIDRPTLQWSYLANDQWMPLAATDLVADTTNGLLNTGIIQLNIPEAATHSNTLMPGALHWLKLSCDHNSNAVSDTIQIMAQGLSATFASEEVAANHFVDLLPAGTITETLEPNPKIRTIEQPYTSGKGRPAEKDAAFYIRISERLRHKNRAVTMWDYERLVLERFPEVYKVKCLPANDAGSGRVNVMVIPDVRGKLPFNPFQPKVPADVLFQIQQHLEMVAPAYADMMVNNPSYLQIKIRCVVKFKPGYNEGFYKARLIEELKRFLSPWAYGEGNDITIGGTIYSSVIINFIAEQPYIDFVANIKLFQSEDGKQFTDVRMLNDGKNQVVAYQPDMILVSSTTHEIDVVDENGYDEDSYEGINYMKVELDFQVGEDLTTR